MASQTASATAAPSPGGVQAVVQSLHQIAGKFGDVAKANNNRSGLILTAPNGTSYLVTVDDTGHLQTTPTG